MNLLINWICGYPKALDSIFMTRRCPDCGYDKFRMWQDGGHDEAIECRQCYSKFGINHAPFFMIERIHQ